MMIRTIISFCFCLLVKQAVQAQTAEAVAPAESHGQILQSTGFSGTGANIDVQYHRIYWRINPDSTKYIKGYVFTKFKTIQANVNTISFDLRSVLVVDSVKFRGALLPAGNITRTGNVMNITLGTTLANQFTDSLTVYYQGVPPIAAGAAQGYQKSSNAGAGNFITTLSESYEDRDWWPCKADMLDKIDSMDILVNVPWGTPTAADTFWVASNGKLIDSTISGTSRTFRFSNRYPIASYLVCVSVAKYNRYYRSVVVGGTEMQVVYNLFKGKTAGTYTNILNAMDRVTPVLSAFSTKFGDYPFKNEKHGFYDGLLGAGGMEHQTFSGIATGSLQSVSTLVHELMHQWFGDNVTFGTWNDLWLAEGFARYSEALCGELVPSLGINPYTVRNSFKNNSITLSSASAWIPDGNITNSDLIWNTSYGSTVYERGAIIVSMLRTLCGDAKFFQAMTNYQTQLAGKSASADSLRNHINRVLGRDIAVFFNDYVGGSGNAAIAVGGIGHPSNTVSWNNPSANKLVVQMTAQSKSAGSNVNYFRGPVVLHVKGSVAAQDTTICFFDWGGGNLSYAGNGVSLPVSGNRLAFNLSFNPITVVYDDSARILSTGSTPVLGGLDTYIWYGTVDNDWTNAANWSSAGVPPDGADITIATVGNNQPVLQKDVIVGPLNILSGNTIILNDLTLTLNNTVKGSGTFTGSPLSNIIVADSCGVLNFNQANSTTRSLNKLTMNQGTKATIGNGVLELYGMLDLPKGARMDVNAVNLIIH